MTGVRLGGRLLAGYLLASTVLAMLARATRWAAAVRIADFFTLPAIRRLATGTAGLVVVAGPRSRHRRADRPDPIGAHRRTDRPPGPAAGAATAPTPTPSSTGPVNTGAWPALGLLPSTAAEGVPTTWTVRPGDSLWVIAKSVLHSAWGRAPTDEETGRFWVVVVALNRPWLSDPANAKFALPRPTNGGPASPTSALPVIDEPHGHLVGKQPTLRRQHQSVATGTDQAELGEGVAVVGGQRLTCDPPPGPQRELGPLAPAASPRPAPPPRRPGRGRLRRRRYTARGCARSTSAAPVVAVGGAPEPPIVALVPVEEVVTALVPGPGPVGDLVPLEAGGRRAPRRRADTRRPGRRRRDGAPGQAPAACPARR